MEFVLLILANWWSKTEYVLFLQPRYGLFFFLILSITGVVKMFNSCEQIVWFVFQMKMFYFMRTTHFFYSGEPHKSKNT